MFSHYSFQGRYMYHGAQYGSAYSAFMSPPIMKDNNTCFLVFYFKLWRTGRASLSVLIEEFHSNASANSSIATTLWNTDATTNSWKKQTLALPQTKENYLVIVLGYYNSRSYYDRGFVALDDVQLISCDTRMCYCSLIDITIIITLN